MRHLVSSTQLNQHEHCLLLQDNKQAAHAAQFSVTVFSLVPTTTSIFAHCVLTVLCR